MLGFSLTSPDLVICGGGSPDIFPKSGSYGDSPEILERSNCKYSTEVSLENGIKGSDISNNTLKTPIVRFSSFNKELSPKYSLELHPPLTAQEDSPKGHIPVVSINAGTSLKAGVDFSGSLIGTYFCRLNPKVCESDFVESQGVLRMSQGAVSQFKSSKVRLL